MNTYKRSQTSKTSKPNYENLPKHLRNRKGHQKQQEIKADHKRTNMKLTTLFVIFALILGSGLFVYNMDEVYLRDKNDITLSFSNNFRSGGDAPVVITVSDFDGGPVADQDVKIELEYEQENKVKVVELTDSKTDDDGITTPTLELPDEFNGTAKLVVTVNEQRIEQPIIIEEPEDVFTAKDEERLRILISTDKPLYQPGQTINIRVLAMYGETKGVYSGKITVEVDDPEGNKLFRKELVCNDWGITGTNFTVTDQMPIGNYKILAKVGAKEAKKSVTIKRYVLPKFNIVYDGVKSWYTVDEDITGTLNCKYFFGKTIKGDIAFKARTSYGGIWDTVYQTAGKLTDDGTFEFTVPAVEYAVGMPITYDNGLVELNATITDGSGHTESKLMPVTIARKPILLTTISDTNIRGAESRYFVLAQAPDGSIVEAADIKASVDTVPIFQGSTNSRGLSEFNFKYEGQAELEIVAEKGNISAEETVDIIEGSGIKLATDKMYYSVGELAEFDVYYSGDSFTRWVYYDVISNGFTITTGALKLNSDKLGKGTFELDLTPEMVGTTYVRVYKIEKDEDVVSDRMGLAVAPTSELEVSIDKDDDIYNPAQPAVITFRVTQGGEPIQGALGVAIIDQSLYALTEQFGGFEDIYFELEQTALEPQYQIWSYVFDIDNTEPAGAVPLPERSVLDPGEYEEGYTYPIIGLQSNRQTELENADNEMVEYISLYWAGVFILIFVGLVGITFYGIRKKRYALTFTILGILVIATVVSGVVLNIENLDEIQTIGGLYEGADVVESKDSDGQNANGGDMDDGGIMWDEEEPPRDAMGGKEADNDGWPNAPGLFPTGKDDKSSEGDYSSSEDNPPSQPEPQGAGRESRKVRVREYFPETWYWNPVLITDESGTAKVELTTPDSITTWEVKAVASTKDAKIGVTNENLTVFQQFFIEPDIPVSVVRNDTFPLRIMVYNYDEVARDITVYLEEDSWFEVIDETEKMVTVQSDNVSKVMFTIRALEVGEHNVTLSGYNGKAWDDIIKPMRVDPDGKRVEQTFNGKLTDNNSAKITIEQSSDRVPGSEDAFVKLQGGMEAVLLDGAESFIRFVSGCGEQSMSTLNIDILAFDTVQKLGTATEEKMFEYEQITTQGIQHEMQYLLDAKNGKGRGIVWFPGDEDVHQWLTSWGLITFQDAIDAGFTIDSDIITDMQSWLISQQEDDGSFVFPERGLYEFTNPILRAKTISCSAYITRSLIYSGYPTSSTSIQKAVTYIEDHAKDDESWDDPYTLSLVLIVLEDANGDSNLRNQLANRLIELKNEDTLNGTAWWTSGTSMITDSDDMEMGIGMEMDFGWGYGSGSNYHTIETTGYAVMALAKAKGVAGGTVQKGVKYLIENRQGLGGWFSTQDTVLAFQALKVAGMNDIDELTVELHSGSKKISQVEFDESNIDITYLIDLRPYLKETTEITIKTIGSGSIMYQVYYEQFIPWHIIGADKPKEMILNISYDTTSIKVNDQITATLELKYQGAADHVKMVLVDLRAPVGFSFVEDDFKAMKSSGDISQYEINNRQAYLYIEDLTYNQTLRVQYRLEAKDPIRGTIQGVQAYDMYNPGLNAEVEPIEVVATE
jgi:hypothetical protein